jgi:hypothetical protein
MKKLSYSILLLLIAIVCNSCVKPANYDIFGSIEGTVRATSLYISNDIRNTSITLIKDGRVMRQCFTDSKSSNEEVFHFTKLDAGEYILSVSKNGYDTVEQTINVYSSETTSIAIMLTKIAKENEEKIYGSIRGILHEQYIYQRTWTNEIHTQYCDEALICLYAYEKTDESPIKSTMTDLYGNFNIENILEGVYTIHFSKRGYFSKSFPVAINSNKETFLTETLDIE